MLVMNLQTEDIPEVLQTPNFLCPKGRYPVQTKYGIG